MWLYGLIEDMKEMLPFIEHRQCVRHINQNLQKRYSDSGAHYSNLFWRVARSTTEQTFKNAMKELKLLNPCVPKYLMDKDPNTWSLAVYKSGR